MSESRLVMGFIEPMEASKLRLGARFAARESTKSAVDMNYVRDLAERRTGPAAEAAVGRQLLNLAARGEDTNALAKAMQELFEHGNGVRTGKTSPTAVKVANRIVTPESLVAMSGQEGGVDLITLAYAVLHLDECNRLNGGRS